MQIVGRERGRFPVWHAVREFVDDLSEIVLPLWSGTCEDQKVLRPRKSHVVFAPEVEELRPLQRLERQTRKVLQFEDSIKVRPVLAWCLRKRADDRDGELQPLRLVDRHHRDAAGRDRLLVVLKLLKSTPIEEMQELAEEMFEVVLKPLRVEDVDGVDEFEL